MVIFYNNLAKTRCYLAENHQPGARLTAWPRFTKSISWRDGSRNACLVCLVCFMMFSLVNFRPWKMIPLFYEVISFSYIFICWLYGVQHQVLLNSPAIENHSGECLSTDDLPTNQVTGDFSASVGRLLGHKMDDTFTVIICTETELWTINIIHTHLYVWYLYSYIYIWI